MCFFLSFMKFSKGVNIFLIIAKKGKLFNKPKKKYFKKVSKYMYELPQPNPVLK